MASSSIGKILPDLIVAGILALSACLLSFLCPDMPGEQRALLASLVAVVGFAVLVIIGQRLGVFKEWLARQWRYLVIVFLLVLIEVLLFLAYADWKIIAFSIAHFALIAVAARLLISRNGDGFSWRFISHPSKVVGLAAINDALYAATADNQLWMRKPLALRTSWTGIGHAQQIVTMAAGNGRLFAITRGGKLWMREPVPHDISWNPIAQGESDMRVTAGVVTMAAIKGKLFAATNHALLVCELDASEISWREIGKVEGIEVMTAFDNRLFARTHDNRLLVCDPSAPAIFWQEIGYIENVTAMAAIKNTIFAIKEG